MKVFVIAGINMSLTNLRTARLCRPEKPGSVVHKIDSLAQSQYPLLFISYSFVIYLFLSYIVYLLGGSCKGKLSLVSGNLGIAPPYLVFPYIQIRNNTSGSAWKSAVKTYLGAVKT